MNQAARRSLGALFLSAVLAAGLHAAPALAGHGVSYGGASYGYEAGFRETPLSVMHSQKARAYARALQAALNERGYWAGPVDGVVGPRTRAAIRDYQRDAGLPVNGRASVELLDHIKFAHAGRLPAPDRGAAPWPPHRDRSYRPWDDDRRYPPAAYYPGRYERDDDEDDWDDDWDDRYGDDDWDERYDDDDWDDDRGWRDGRNGPVDIRPGRGSGQGPRHGPGQGDAKIRAAEQDLASLGYATGPVDGIADARTASAVRAFEKDWGLPVTGEVDDDLLETLRLVRTTG